MEVMFSPPPGIPARIARAIDDAQLSIHVCMYHFSESTLAQRMAAAVGRGVECCVILDRGGAYETQSMAWQLARTGVQVWTDAAHSIMHAKYAIIDGLYVLTGSANWSYNADGRAAEDFIIFGPDAQTTTPWMDDWRVHRSHSIPLPRSAWPPSPPTGHPMEPPAPSTAASGLPPAVPPFESPSSSTPG